MSISANRLSRRARIVMPVLMNCAGSAQAQIPAWLALPAWTAAPDVVIAAEGPSAIAQMARPGSRVFDQDFLVETPVQAGDLSLRRQFYFDDQKQLTVVRIMPATVSGPNCSALLAVTKAALGTPDETNIKGGVPSIAFENAFWFRRNEDRLYRWGRMNSKAIPDDRKPCHVIIEPYQAGMARAKKG